MKPNFASLGCSILLSVTTLAACAYQYPATGEVTSYGLMRDVWKSTGGATCDSPSADGIDRTGVVITQKTDKIPGMRYIKFGIKYKLSGDIKNSYIKYRGVVTHPPMKTPKGKTSTGETFDIECLATKDTVSGWARMTFSEEYEIVAGKWTFEVWSRDRKLFQKEFTVVELPRFGGE